MRAVDVLKALESWQTATIQEPLVHGYKFPTLL